jgi:Tfp pilus assembly ATPase PilU
MEILFETPALAASIREGKTYKISDIIRAGKAAGMLTMDNSLRDFISEGVVEPLAAFDKAIDKDSMRNWLGLIRRAFHSGDRWVGGMPTERDAAHSSVGTLSTAGQ